MKYEDIDRLDRYGFAQQSGARKLTDPHKNIPPRRNCKKVAREASEWWEDLGDALERSGGVGFKESEGSNDRLSDPGSSGERSNLPH